MTLKSEKTLDLWPRQARSAEARPMHYRELNGYEFTKGLQVSDKSITIGGHSKQGNGRYPATNFFTVK
ncbi:MAG: hypothetical protein IT327_22160 [Anaerolineae bacterium]|nr:hypothetical protein [Anaerolineae bacterium]